MLKKYENVNILFASYTYESYEGQAFVLCEIDGNLFEVNGGHCSCCGLEGQWRPDEVSLQELENRMLKGTFGEEYYWSGDIFKMTLCEFLGVEFKYNSDMMRIEEIRDFIWSFYDEDCEWFNISSMEHKEIVENLGFIFKNDELYHKEKRYIGNGLMGVITLTNAKFNTEIKLKEVGSFDGSGYGMYSYAWAGIIDDELYFDNATNELY